LASIAASCAAAGVHVLVEKPGANRLEPLEQRRRGRLRPHRRRGTTIASIPGLLAKELPEGRRSSSAPAWARRAHRLRARGRA
jgi:hypothetical protein